MLKTQNTNHMATQTGTTVGAAAEAKPEAKVDVTLASLFKKQDQSFADILKYIKDGKIDREVIKVTLMESRGLSKASAGVETSRIAGFLKPENEAHYNDFIAGKITLREFRKLAQVGSGQGRKPDSSTPQTPPKPEDVYTNNFYKLGVYAVQQRKTLEEFLKEAQVAFESATTAIAKAKEAAQAATGTPAPQSGSMEATPAQQPAAQPAANAKKQKAA